MINCSFNWPEMSRIVGPCIRPGGSLLTERALEICHIPAGSRIVDIGCGAGGTLEQLERPGIYRLVGLDLSKTLLGEAVPRVGTGRLVQGRAEKLPFKKDFFDALFCECVLSILEDKSAALHEFARVLKNGGFLVVSDVFGKGDHGTAGHADGLLTQEEIHDLVSGSGFTILHWEAHDRLLKEFAARMILAGGCLPDSWMGGKRQKEKEKKTDRTSISYFLLVARKSGDVSQ